MPAVNLDELGWDADFSEAFARLGRRDIVPGRVIRGDKLHYRVWTEQGRVTARLAGRMLRGGAAEDAGPPAVGDWVAVKVQRGRGRGTVRAVLPRHGWISRKVAGKHAAEQVLAANVDVVLLLSGLDGDYNPRRVERFLALVAGSGAEPVVILNKSDLCQDQEELAELVDEVSSCAPGVPVRPVCALDGAGVDAVAEHLAPGRTVALLGSSGVGKSTLVNLLAGEERMKVGELRDRDGRGCHTTTHRQLILLPDDRGVLIDTPGLRELQLWGDREQLDAAFPDIAESAARCRFNDCAHEAEPGCAVQAAVEADELLVDRYDSYIKLRGELSALALRQEQQGRRGSRARSAARAYREVADTRQRRRGS